MTEKKKAAPVDQPGNGREERAAALAGSTSCSCSQFNTSQSLMASVLREGKENAITGREIKRVLALKDGRDVSALVERERRRGVPICASCDRKAPGYFLPKTADELAAYNRSLRRRVKNVTATLEAMEEAFEDWTGQQRLDFDETEDHK